MLSQKKPCHTDRISQLKQCGIHTKLIVGRQRLVKLIKLYQILLKEKPDVVVCHGYSEHIWGRYAALLARVPGIIHVEHSAQEPYSQLKIKQLRWLTKRSNRVICCAQPVRNRLLELGCQADKCITIENGIDIKLFRPEQQLDFRKKANNIVMVARFNERKDHGSLLQAMRILVKQNYSGNLLLAGEGDNLLIEKYRGLACELGIEHRVKFLGNLASPAVAELLLNNQIFVLCSNIEGMPLAICEAMAAACVVLASDITGIKEVVRHGEDGLLVPPKDSRQLAKLILHLEANQEEKIRLSLAARKRALKEFDNQNMLGQYVQQIKMALQNR